MTDHETTLNGRDETTTTCMSHLGGDISACYNPSVGDEPYVTLQGGHFFSLFIQISDVPSVIEVLQKALDDAPKYEEEEA